MSELENLFILNKKTSLSTWQLMNKGDPQYGAWAMAWLQIPVELKNEFFSSMDMGWANRILPQVKKQAFLSGYEQLKPLIDQKTNKTKHLVTMINSLKLIRAVEGWQEIQGVLLNDLYNHIILSKTEIKKSIDDILPLFTQRAVVPEKPADIPFIKLALIYYANNKIADKDPSFNHNHTIFIANTMPNVENQHPIKWVFNKDISFVESHLNKNEADLLWSLWEKTDHNDKVKVFLEKIKLKSFIEKNNKTIEKKTRIRI
jgi:hypothetical protein